MTSSFAGLGSRGLGWGPGPLKESGACLNGLVRQWDQQPLGRWGFDILRPQVLVPAQPWGAGQHWALPPGAHT